MTTAYKKSNPESIQKMFNSIADKYDRGNAILSFNMHKIWNRRLIKETLDFPHSHTLLDLCCGTGEIAFTHLNQEMRSCEAHLLDFSEQMLRCAQAKSHKLSLNHHQIHYHHADAQEIPLQDEMIDGCTIAYGIRNVANPQKCFKDVYRILKKGGRFGILELSRPKAPLLRILHATYLKTLLPLLGKFVATNKEAYNYLSESIYLFIPPEDMAKILENTGFHNVRVLPLMGGLSTIIVAEK